MTLNLVTPWARCAACGQVVRINKPVIGSLHLCLTECEQRRSHVPEKHRVGPFWARRDEIRCQDCLEVLL